MDTCPHHTVMRPRYATIGAKTCKGIIIAELASVVAGEERRKRRQGKTGRVGKITLAT